MKEIITNQTENLVKLRIHYSNLKDNSNEDLDSNNISSLINSFLKFNLKIQYSILYNTNEFEVIEIVFEKDMVNIFLKDMKLRQTLEKASILELININTTSHSFEGSGLGKNYPYKLINNLGYTINSVSSKGVKPENIDLWINLLKEKWELFYNDVKDKECAIDYFNNGQFKVRRKFLNKNPAIFNSVQDLDILREIQAVSVIPTCHKLLRPKQKIDIESIIDIDPGIFSTDEEKITVIDTFTEYLNLRGLNYHKRISGGSHDGIHFIIPLQIVDHYKLITNIASPINYFANLREKIIINSVRESTLALILGFLREYKSDNILSFVDVSQDQKKIRLDYTRSSYKTGRRSILSSHKSTNRVVIPIPSNKLIETQSNLNYYREFSKIDIAYSLCNEIKERQITQDQIKHNSTIFEFLVEDNKSLWELFHTTLNKTRFFRNYL